jgi:site-specific DNA recombinase
MRAGVYVRISDDRDGSGAGVKRQEDDCRTLVEKKGWTVARVYSDNDLSAYGGKTRPAYQEMLKDIESGTVNAIVVYHLDRLTRHPRELEEFLDVVDRAGVKSLATVTGDIDLASSDGRLMARILGSAARKESDDKSRRIRRKHEELAKAGKVGGGGTRPFGFEADRATIDDAEAELIREAADRVLAGESVKSILRDWNLRGIPSVTGAPWRSNILRRTLTSARIAGLRRYRGETIGPAVWDAIVDEETHRRLLTALAKGPHKAGRKYLLTGGIAFCGLCDAKLVARPKGDGRPCYVCASGVDFNGCGKIRQLSAPLDELVRDEVTSALDSPALMEMLSKDPADAGERANLMEFIAEGQASLDQLSVDHYSDRVISRSEYMAARQAIESKVEGFRSKLRSLESGRALADIPAGGANAIRSAWDEASVGWRRALVQAVIERVIVGPAIKGQTFFNKDRVTIEWRV